MTPVEWAFRRYPSRRRLYQTSDGILHLSRDLANAQARHLTDQTVTTIPRPPRK